MVNAVKFDGANDYLTRGGDLTGIVDGKSGIVSFWIRFDGKDGYTTRILVNKTTAIQFQVFKQSDNTIRVYGANSSSTLILSLVSSTTLVASSKWYHILVSWDLATGGKSLYINDVPSLSATVTATNDVIDYSTTSANWTIGAGGSVNEYISGALSEFYFAPNQYLDFSVEANRRKFIDADGKPVSLGATGATPTGTAPAIYLKGDNTAFGVNSGTGGNFTVNGALEIASSTPTDAFVNAVDFDGTNDYLSKASALSGVVDGKTGLLSVWVKIDADVANGYVIYFSKFRVSISISSSYLVEVRGLRASDYTSVLALNSSVQHKAAPKFLHILSAWDLSAGVGYLYVNDVNEKAAGATISNENINYSFASEVDIGASGGGANKLNGAISELYFAPNQYLDFSVTANRRKFIDAEGKPVSLGANGELPTGTAPAIYLNKRAALVGSNAGTGGNFTINGAPKDANSTPLYYYAEPVKFDGTTAYLVRGGDLTGIADGKQGTISFWCRRDANTQQTIFATAGSFNVRLTIQFNLNKLQINGTNSSVVDVISASSNTARTDGQWHHYLASWDIATSTWRVYVDNSSDAAGSPYFLNDNIDYAGTGNFGVGAFTDGTQKLNGALADLWFNTTYIDLSIAANRAKFIDQTTLRPVPLGAKGELPTGSQPLLYLGRDAANWGVNLGSGGNFT